jgi:hypothetical protein
MTTYFHTATKVSGSNQTSINVDRDGKPFGQLWTFNTKDETHGWHAKTLGGAYAYFDYIPDGTFAPKIKALIAAREWMEAA